MTVNQWNANTAIKVWSFHHWPKQLHLHAIFFLLVLVFRFTVTVCVCVFFNNYWWIIHSKSSPYQASIDSPSFSSPIFSTSLLSSPHPSYSPLLTHLTLLPSPIFLSALKRRWEGPASSSYVRPPWGSAAFDFSVMSYNILSQELLQDNAYLYRHCDPGILPWNHRLPNLLAEIKQHDADVSRSVLQSWYYLAVLYSNSKASKTIWPRYDKFRKVYFRLDEQKFLSFLFLDRLSSRSPRGPLWKPD